LTSAAAISSTLPFNPITYATSACAATTLSPNAFASCTDIRTLLKWI
jgi:hypothetical protein